MASLHLRTTKPAPKKHTLVTTPPCRRCGGRACTCSDEELDAGGPANA